jgi:hypothetical protein
MDVLGSIKTVLGISLGFLRNNLIILLIFIWLFGQLFFLFKENSSENMFSKHYFNIIITWIPIAIIVFYLFNLNSSLFDDKGDSRQKTFSIMKIVGGIIAIVLIVVGTWYLNAPRKSPSGETIDPIINADVAKQLMFFINIIGGAIVLFGLVIFGRILKDVAYSVEGWLGVFLRIIFFIPCMLYDLFNYIVGEFARSPLVVYVLLAIEVLLILVYLYLPTLLAQFTPKAGHKLLSDPVTLKNKIPIISLGNLYKKHSLTLVPGTYRLYTISMWFYVVGMPTSQYPYNQNANIFSLTNSDASKGHPQIMYNGAKNMCVVNYDNEPPSAPVEFKIPLQKWVHFVIVYDSSNIDIFINGDLKKSIARGRTVKLNLDDTITVGQDNGLQGGICNIMHYARPLIKTEIITLYELNKDVDPPIN